MRKAAWLFPGHGSQYVGMGHALFDSSAAGQAWLARAERCAGQALGDALQRGPRTVLMLPRMLEPLLAALSCAYVDVLHAAGHRPAHLAGYSAGELPALYAAGVLDADSAMRIACLRGRALERVLDQVDGGMAALSGIDGNSAAALVAGVVAMPGLAGAVCIAGYNGGGNFTVSGTHAGLAALGRNLGGRATLAPLDVGGPWHSPLVAAAASEIAAGLDELTFSAPHTPLWLGSLGGPCHALSDMRRSLAASVAAPVLWEAVIDGLIAQQVERFVEVGPGRVLYGLLGQQAPPSIERDYQERQGARRRRFQLNENKLKENR